jgi:hypothetical protein
MTTSSQEVNASGLSPRKSGTGSYSTAARFASAVVFAAALAWAPIPAFAQHGGGGGGGHAGGGGGGGHAGGGSGGAGSHGGGGSAPSGGSHPSSANASGSGGGHWWNPFHSTSSANEKSSSAVAGGSGKSENGSNAGVEHYAAGNNTWQDPPAAEGRTQGRVNYYAPANAAGSSAARRNPASGVMATRGASAVAAPPHVFPPRRPGYPYYPYYPFYPYYGFGWGGGLWGGFYPCDPFWGCYGYGYGSDGGYGYYGGSFGGDYGADLSYNSGYDDSGSQELNPTLFASPPSDVGATSSGGESQQPYVMLYLKDGSSYAVSDYWLSGGRLHYVTSYGGENVIDESQLDLQRTVDENAARGVDFTLRPEPGGSGEAAPATTGPAPDAKPSVPKD